MAESKEATELKRIYAEKGDVNNVEFYECARRFFFYLQHRYIGERVEEIDGDFWARLVESMEYYDPKKLNIVSWVYTIGRNVCSSYNYQKRKRENESEEELQTLQQDDSIETIDQLLLDEEILAKVSSSRRVRAVTDDFSGLGNRLLHLPHDHPIKRHLQWEVLKLSLT